MRIYQKYFKRLMDIFISLSALLILAPLILVITMVQLIIYRGKPFYLQERPGLNCSVFKIIKFKTMSDHRGADGELLPDEIRLNSFGQFLRWTSLDEILQFVNILKGDMSLIGPRPLLKEYLPLYNEFQNRRHRVKPGITGWAQVKGRNQVNWEERFRLDVWYTENVTLLLDLKIVILTAVKVLTAHGIRGEGSQTMKKFKGN